ncbi:DUF3050 domain-containing protein [Pseudomonas sp. MAFF 301514]|uniref:DUF3050 domain-containing protein n=1 Tax=Pseudomonas allii TaxID=2740531 RepID=A0A7Y8RNZ8_9PSED|nr:DUF3050 domain-containing protein [Pseudomonas allii]NWN49141.1 DUF3050 domain-containing protein [Pseudomonas allii]NWN62025.1 DUF3050 domain-containing protein [Pseudomonas allii]
MHQPLLETAKLQLCSHSLFSEITSLRKLQLFMESHVFAVWDFMTLAKRLQQDLTCTRLPWLPPSDPQAARLINEIVLGEESDEHPAKGYCSHFELYLEAMAEVGANAASINHFITLLRQGLEAHAALQEVEVLPGVVRFVSDTLNLALNAPTHCVAATFLHGREHVIPAMFQRILQSNELIHRQAPTLCAYLKRHIEMDARDHGPAAEQLLERLASADPAYAHQAHEAALAAMEGRSALWDEIQASLQEVRP